MTEYIDRTQEPDEAFTALLESDGEEPTVEKVARALCDGDAADHGVYTWAEAGEELREDYRRAARHAIDALKGPALAVFRGQQDPAVQRVLTLLAVWERQVEEPRELADWQVASRATQRRMASVVRDLRAAIGGDGR